MSQPLQIPAILPVSQSFTVRSLTGELGDGQDQHALPFGRIVDDSWQITTPPLPKPQIDALADSFKALSPTGFSWRLREPQLITAADFNVYTWELPFDNYGEYHCESWDTTWIGGDYWQLSVKIDRDGHQEIDECFIRPTDLATTYPLFPLNLYTQGNKQSLEAKTLAQRFNGGVEERAAYGYNAVKDTWNFTATVTEAKKREVVDFLSDRCGNFFEFRVDPNVAGKIYTCNEWSAKLLGQNWQGTVWEVSVTFKRSHLPFRKSDVLQIIENFDYYNDQDEIRQVMAATFADIDEKLDGAYDWLLRYKRAEYPLILNEQWLLVNSFHTVLGRGGYFPPSAGPTEAQAVIARASMYAYYATGKDKWLELAKNTGDALLNYFYPVKIPSGWTPADGIRVPHWLINIKSPFVSKGALSTTGDPLNMGHFGLVLNFVNGVAQIPYGAPNFGELVANVYRVYPVGDRLLWQNVFARPIGGFEYGIDYWVTNVMLDGIISRQYGDSESPSGRRPTPTDEPVGKIVLTAPFTGQAKVVYSSYSGPAIGINALFEPYPMWRELRPAEALAAIDVFPWSEDAYDFLWQTTQDLKWLDARECTRYSEIIAATVINPTAWYKRDDSPNPFAYPGSQIILANHPPGATFSASRVLDGDKKDWLRCDVPASPELYPSAELQNFAVQAQITGTTSIFVEYAHSEATEIEVILSLSKNPFDFTQYYTARLPVPGGGIPVGRLFSPREFLLWDVARTSWHPYIADNPVYTYQGLGGTTDIAREQQVIDGIPRAVWRVTLDRNGGFAGAGFVCIGAKPRVPLTIFYKHTGANARLIVTIAEKKYSKNITASDWGQVTIQAQSFEDSDGKSPSGGFATNVEIEANGESTTYVWWIGAEPQELPAPVQTYKAVLVSRVKTAHTFWCGQFEGIGSPSSELPFVRGCVPFTANVLSDGKGGQVLDAWRGLPASGYCYPGWYARQGYWDRLDIVLDFLSQAQDAFRDQSTNKVYGPFIGSYIWGYWDAGEYSPTGAVDYFAHVGIDPNIFWCGYQTRPLLSSAEAWYRLATGDHYGISPENKEALIAKAQKIVMTFLNWLSSFYVKRRSFQPPTDYKEKIDPEVNYHEPHQAGFILKAAIYANLAGGNKATTMRLIKASLDYLDLSYFKSGNMQGSFAAGQPMFPDASNVLFSEYFGFWHCEIYEGYALLKLHKDALQYPKCAYFIRKPAGL